MKLLLVLMVLILSGCASAGKNQFKEGLAKSTSGYVIDEMDVDRCNNYPSLMVQECFNSMARDLTTKLKAKYHPVSDRKLEAMSKDLPGGSIREAAVALEDRAKEYKLRSMTDEELNEALIQKLAEEKQY